MSLSCITVFQNPEKGLTQLSFIHSINVLGVYYVSHVVLSAGDKTEDKVPALTELTYW